MREIFWICFQLACIVFLLAGMVYLQCGHFGTKWLTSPKVDALADKMLREKGADEDTVRESGELRRLQGEILNHRINQYCAAGAGFISLFLLYPVGLALAAVCFIGSIKELSRANAAVGEIKPRLMALKAKLSKR